MRDDRLKKAGNDFSTFFRCQKNEIHQIFDQMVANPKKLSFNQIELFRIEDPSILVGDYYDLHFGHNQDEQERYPPSF